MDGPRMYWADGEEEAGWPTVWHHVHAHTEKRGGSGPMIELSGFPRSVTSNWELLKKRGQNEFGSYWPAGFVASIGYSVSLGTFFNTISFRFLFIFTFFSVNVCLIMCTAAHWRWKLAETHNCTTKGYENLENTTVKYYDMNRCICYKIKIPGHPAFLKAAAGQSEHPAPSSDKSGDQSDRPPSYETFSWKREPIPPQAASTRSNIYRQSLIRQIRGGIWQPNVACTYLRYNIWRLAGLKIGGKSGLQDSSGGNFYSGLCWWLEKCNIRSILSLYSLSIKL